MITHSHQQARQELTVSLSPSGSAEDEVPRFLLKSKRLWQDCHPPYR